MEKVACRTPNPDKPGVTNIPKWKFNVLREAILLVLAPGPAKFSELASKVKQELTQTQIKEMGSIGWHVTTVKLELEVRGEIHRSSQNGVQVLRT